MKHLVTLLMVLSLASRVGAATIVQSSGSSWVVPPDWNNSTNTVSLIGPGNNGLAGTAPSGGAGGAGGNYNSVGAVTGLSGSVSYVIGGGGSGTATSFNSGAYSAAAGGGGAGGSAAIAGGGGGGGASIGSGVGAGGNGSSGVGGAGGTGSGTDAGNGGAGGSSSGNGSNGTVYGGGGGGSGAGATAGSGASGAIIITYTPVAPSGLSATGGAGKINLSWTSVSYATSYNLYRAATSGGEGAATYTGITGTAYTDVSVVGGTKYYYTVAAVNSGTGQGTSGAGVQSSEVNATTLSSGPPAFCFCENRMARGFQRSERFYSPIVQERFVGTFPAKLWHY